MSNSTKSEIKAKNIQKDRAFDIKQTFFPFKSTNFKKLFNF